MATVITKVPILKKFNYMLFIIMNVWKGKYHYYKKVQSLKMQKGNVKRAKIYNKSYPRLEERENIKICLPHFVEHDIF